MPNSTHTQTVHLRVVCINPPAELWDDKPTVFGLQNKSGELTPGMPEHDGSWVFTCRVQAKPGDPVNFTGEYTHGTPKDRFLYLSLRHIDQPGVWIRRLKVRLSAITWGQVRAAENSTLEATIDGQAAGSARLIGGGWVVQ